MKTTDPVSIDFKEKFSLKGKVILIVGACGLIGKAFVESCAQFGASVVLADIKDVSPKDKATKVQNRFEQKIIGIPVNVSMRESVKSLLENTLDVFGRVDGLVNAHQFKPKTFFKRFEEYDDSEWDAVINTNLNGTFLTCQIVGGWMAENNLGGSIINMPSLYSVVAPNQNLYKGTSLGSPAAYSASKGGVIALSQYLATYWASKKIRVNMITPHGVWNNHEKSFESNFSNFLPMMRMSYNHEVAPALVFLLSEASSFVTGHNLIIDGGWTTW